VNQAKPTTNSLCSAMLAATREGGVRRIEVHGRELEVTMASGDEVTSHIGRNTDLTAVLAAEGVAIGGATGLELEFDRPSEWGGFLPLIINFLPLLVFVAVFYYTIRNAVREGMRRGRDG
jgi:hypothetical protein